MCDFTTDETRIYAPAETCEPATNDFPQLTTADTGWTDEEMNAMLQHGGARRQGLGHPLQHAALAAVAAGQALCCRIVADADPGQPGAAPRRDLPRSFSPVHRRYAYRAAAENEVVLQPAAGAPGPETEHDPFAEL